MSGAAARGRLEDAAPLSRLAVGRHPARRGRGSSRGIYVDARGDLSTSVDETKSLASDSCFPSFPTLRRAILPRTCKRTKHRRWPRAGLCLASTQFQAPCTSFFPPIMLPSPSLVRMRCLYAYSAPVFWTFILHVSLLSSLPGTFQNRIVLFMCTMSAMS